MLYEIYQLKIALNILDKSEEEEDEEDIKTIFAQKFHNISEPKPPTPPKALNDNKVIEKLEAYEKLEEKELMHNKFSRDLPKTVTLIDANPQLLLTEKDVLSTLLETNIDPLKVKDIYTKLFQKSNFARLKKTVYLLLKKSLRTTFLFVDA